MKCSYNNEYIDKYFEGLLPEEELEKFERHIQTCDECRIYYRSLNLSKKHMTRNEKLDYNIFDRLEGSIDKNRYSRKSVGFKLTNLFYGLAPAIKPIAIIFAVCLCALSAYKGSQILGSLSGNWQVTSPVSTPSADNKNTSNATDLDNDDINGPPAYIKIGENYRIKVKIAASEDPQPIGAGLPLFITTHFSEYKAEDFKGHFVQISSTGNKGWIPGWYMSQEVEQIKDLTPFQLLIKDTTRYSIYPDELIPSGITLEKGIVVKVEREYKDWYGVEFITYDRPYYDWKWIKKTDLIPFNPDLAIEGRVKAGAKLYNEHGEIVDDVLPSAFKIIDKKNDMYQVIAPGGYSGYIKKDYFVPDPFAPQEKPTSPISSDPPGYSDLTSSQEDDKDPQVISRQQKIYELFKHADSRDTNAEEIINALPQVDWIAYEKISDGGAFELLTWIYDKKFTDTDDMINIFNATTGLDGAFAEQYSNIVGEMSKNHKGNYNRALSRLDPSRAEIIKSFAAYYIQ